MPIIHENFRRGQTTPSASRPRIAFVDLAKGVCILLVVLYHAGVATDIPGLSAVRMPLYFILSGLFFKDYGGFAAFFFKKVNRVLVPFCFFVALGVAGKASASPELLADLLAMPFYKPHVANLPVWFLLVLFWTNLLYFAITRICRQTVPLCVAVAVCGVIGYMLGHAHIYLPLFAASAFSALPFFFAGVVLGRFPIFYKTAHDRYFYAISLPLAAVALVWCCFGDTPFIEFRTNLYFGNVAAIYAVSLALVVGLLMVCKMISWLPVISYFGRYSIIVLGLHRLFLGYAFIPVSMLTGAEPTPALTLALTLLLCWLAIPVMRRWLPKFTAQDDLIKRPQRIAESRDLASKSLF